MPVILNFDIAIYKFQIDDIDIKSNENIFKIKFNLSLVAS